MQPVDYARNVEHTEGNGDGSGVIVLQDRTGTPKQLSNSKASATAGANRQPVPQEADLQRHRTQLVSMGKIENAAGANLRPRRQKSFEESIKAFEVDTTELSNTRQHCIRLACEPKTGMCKALTQLMVQVLPEVLQQQARLDDPGAARRKEIIRFASPALPLSCKQP